MALGSYTFSYRAPPWRGFAAPRRRAATIWRKMESLGRRVTGGLRSLAIALEACTHPGAPGSSFVLPDDQIDFGVGIHGERGIDRRPFAPARELAETLISPIVAALGLESGEQMTGFVVPDHV